MKKVFTLCGAVAAVMTLSVGGAFAAESKCGSVPTLPDLPADGTAVTSKEMDAVAEGFDDYQSKYVEFSKCTNAEFNEAQKKFEALLDQYASKGKKK
ncbi:MAG: hypothetical protein AB7E79_00675 [Rhodospirillaceae bacterium]